MDTRRITFLDELRGFSIILMVIYHLLFDIDVILGHEIKLFNSTLMVYLQLLFSAIFIIISGIAITYSKNSVKRGALYFAIGMGITIVTSVFAPDEKIRFGIFHLLGISIIIYSAIPKSFFIKTKKYMPFIFFAIFLLTHQVSDGYIGILTKNLIPLPKALYKTTFLYPLGLPYVGFSSGDYYPIIPWTFLFLTANYIGLWFKEGNGPEFFYKSHAPILSKIGKHTLAIYILHQPIIMILLYIVSMIRK